MHTLLFLEPGHFHAALTLRERHPLVRDEIVVYAPEAPELREFLALVDAFNRRPERPTGWRPVVRVGSDPLDRLLAERAEDVVILAGKNDEFLAHVERGSQPAALAADTFAKYALSMAPFYAGHGRRRRRAGAQTGVRRGRVASASQARVTGSPGAKGTAPARVRAFCWTTLSTSPPSRRTS